MSKRRPVGITDPAARYAIWKEEHVPLLYDWISSRRLMWPHAAVRWGARVPDLDNRGRNGSSYSTRSLYLAERTGSSTRDANTLLHFEVRVVEEHVNKSLEIASPWLDEAVVTSRPDNMSTPEFWLKKRIIHPGEVNKIRLVAPNVVVTHTDSPELYLWDLKSQPDRKRDDLKSDTSTPTCTLSGHTDMAEYALSVWSSNGPYRHSDEVWIASGGSDRRVLVWKLQDYESQGRNLQPQVTLGPGTAQNQSFCHLNTVEDVSFSRVDRNLIASVGRDKSLIIWDIRQANRAASVVRNAHDGDVNSCDFGGADENLIVSGGSDEIVKIWDKRFLVNQSGGAAPRHSFVGHTGQIHIVAWNRYVANVCASGGEDGQVLVWNCANDTKAPVQNPVTNSPALLFRHIGHAIEDSVVVDLEWEPDESDPWCIASLSETIGDAGGSTVQLWRMSDLVHRPQEVVSAELRQYSNGNGR